MKILDDQNCFPAIFQLKGQDAVLVLYLYLMGDEVFIGLGQSLGGKHIGEFHGKIGNIEVRGDPHGVFRPLEGGLTRIRCFRVVSCRVVVVVVVVTPRQGS